MLWLQFFVCESLAALCRRRHRWQCTFTHADVPFFTLTRPHLTSPSVFWDGCRQKTWSPWVSLHESAVFFFLFPHWVQEDKQQRHSPHTVLYCTGAIQSLITPRALPPSECGMSESVFPQREPPEQQILTNSVNEMPTAGVRMCKNPCSKKPRTRAALHLGLSGH